MSINITFRLFIIAFAFTKSLCAQNYSIQNYGVKEGLSQDFVHAIVQDNHGYLWVGTGTGLSRYNGNNFINYDTINGLSENYVSSLFTQGNKVYVGHNNGAVSLVKKNHAESVLPEGLIKDKITAIAALKEERLIVGTQSKGVFLYNIQNGKIDLIGDFPIINDIQVVDPENIIIASGDGIYRLNYKTEKINKISSDITKSLIINLKDESIWYLSNNSLNRIPKHKGAKPVLIPFQEKEKYGEITAIYFSISGELFIVSDTYLYSVSNSVVKPKVILIKNIGFNQFTCKDFLVDNENNLWIGTYGAGLTYVKKEIFFQLDEFKNKNIKTVYKDSDSIIFLGTTKGLYQYNMIAREMKTNLLVDSIYSVTAIARDNDNRFWVGTENSGLRIIGGKPISSAIMKTINQLSDVEITDIEKDNERIWISTITQGVYMFNLNENTAQVFNTTNKLLHNDVTAMYLDKASNLWLSTSSSKVSFLNRQGELTINTPYISQSVDISIVNEDSVGNVWIGTVGNGIWKDDGVKMHNYDENQGLLSNYILSTICDSSSIWFSHIGGISQISSDNVITGYAQNFDLSQIGFNRNSSARMGMFMFWGFKRGLLVQDIEMINKTKKVEAFLNLVKVNGNPINNELTNSFQPGRYVIDFEVQANSLSRNHHILYQHRLSSEDQFFSDPETISNKVSYSGLSYGEYNYSVRTKLIGGVWSDWVLVYEFTIEKPFYLEWWFLILVLLITILVPFFIFKIRLKIVEKDNERLELLVDMRTKEVVRQKAVVEEKNTEIIQSVEYAEGIQLSMLPQEEKIASSFSDAFVLYKPKDVISGDFYLHEPIRDNIFIAVADCTGHGVPGAMLSVICIGSLRRCMNNIGMTNPAKILDKTRELIKDSFKQCENGRMDGMDITLCVVNKKKQELMIAGANNPLYIIKPINNKVLDEQVLKNNTHFLTKIEGDRQPVGSYLNETPFTYTTIKLEGDELLYMTSDGFLDQFGGPNGKKYKSRTFQKDLLEINQKPMQEQKKILQQKFKDWKGNLDQLDDVCTIGFKV